ncbi:MAG: SRPBCC family protein [Pyrinomonadaceae bacterium]
MKFRKSSEIFASPERVFGFHQMPDAFERLIPPWEDLKIIQKADISEIGSQAIVEQRFLGFPVARIIAEHTKYDPPRIFEDVIVEGPVKHWRHQHIVKEFEDHAKLIDEIEFELPFYFAGSLAASLIVLPKLEKMFEYRHKITKEWCENAGSGSTLEI